MGHAGIVAEQFRLNCYATELLQPLQPIASQYLRRERHRTLVGGFHGSGWESNPPGPPLQHPSDGFEDRGAHRDSTTPT